MSHEPPFPPPDFDDLRPTPEWHEEIISERLAKYRAGDEHEWKTWEEFEQELNKELSKQ